EPTIYTPSGRQPTGFWFVIRTPNEPTATIPAVRRALRELSSVVAIPGIDVVDDLMRRSFSEDRFRTMLISLFAVMAVVPAAVGMYWVTSRAVGGRTRDVGIRVALGATSSSVVWMIVSHTMKGVAIGVVAGALASVAAGQLLVPYLFGVSAH